MKPPGLPDDDRAAYLLGLVEALRAELRAGGARATLRSSLERDLGLDSLARGELLLRVEAAFGVRLPEGTLGRVETPGDLLQALGAARGEATAVVAVEIPLAVAEILAPDHAQTLVEVLRWHASRCPEREHIRFLAAPDRSESLTYGALLDRAEAVAAGLAAWGLQPGQAVAIMLPTSLDFFAAFFGTLLAGGVPAPLYPPASLSRIADHLHRQAGILGNCQAPLLLTVVEARGVSRLVESRVETLRAVLTLADLPTGPAVPPFPARPGDLALLQYTSGSTGNPKGVMLSHANLLANIRAWSRAAALAPGDVCISWLPLYHDMGLIGAWLGSLYNGCRLVLMSPLAFLARPEDWLWAIHRYRGTVTAAPNFAFELCLRRLAAADLAGLDLSSWRLAANGAEPVSAGTVERFCDAFAPFGFRREALLPVYGLAECAVGLAVPPLGQGPRIDRVDRHALARGEAVPAAADDAGAQRLVACGRPLPGHELRVVGEDGAELPERRVGRLQFRGPSATAGYYRNPEASRQLIQGEWRETGDLAYLADGDLFLASRVKDMIIRAGRNLYPYELEEAIGRLPGIRRGCVAVFGVPDATTGSERLVIVAETRETGAETLAAQRGEINRLAVDILDSPADDIVLAPPGAVLKTSSGKLRRAALRDLYAAGRLGLARPTPWRQLAGLAAEGAGAWLGRFARHGLHLAYAGTLWVLAAAFLFVIWPLIALPRWPAWGWRLGGLAARAFLRLAGMAPTVAGAEYLNAPGPAVVVCNHASYLDGIVLMALRRRPAVFVAKRELGEQFFAGALLRGLGTAFVERADAERSVEDAGRLGELAGAGQTLIFFPEGTFTRQAGLRGFRLGAFVAAASRGMPVVPVALGGLRNILRDETWLPRPGRIVATVGPPVAPAGEGWEAALRLRDAARAHILAHCGEADLAPMIRSNACTRDRLGL